MICPKKYLLKLNCHNYSFKELNALYLFLRNKILHVQFFYFKLKKKINSLAPKFYN